MDHKQPGIAADCVVFDAQDRLLLIRRKFDPFRGQYALPGGFIERGETCEQAALRELKEETGIDGKNPRLIGVYSDPKRDPRGPTISISYLVTALDASPTAGDDAAEAQFVADWRHQKLAFDHDKIVQDAVALRRVRQP